MADFSRLFTLENAVLSFLSKFKFLEAIKDACRRFSREIPVPKLYPFVIDVDLMLLLDEDDELYEFILKEPIKGRKLFQEVIYMSIVRMQWLPTLENVSQLLVTIKILSLPSFPEFQISCFQDISKCRRPRYYQLKGIVVAQTAPSIYTKGTVYVCPDMDCEGSSGCKFVRVHVPGFRESVTIRNDLKCHFCNTTLKENVKARVLSEKLVAEMVPIDSFSGINLKDRRQGVPVYFKDELVKEVRLGSCYSVVGVTAGNCVLPLACEEPIHLEVEHAWPITFQPFEIKESTSDTLNKFQSKVEFKLHQLGLDDAKSSPYILPLVISYYFGEHVVAKGLFHKLKMGILMSLAMCECPAAKGNLSLIAVGSDTAILNPLLTFGRNMAPRKTTLTNQHQLKVLVTRDSESGLYCVETNPLLSAGKGICYFGDLGKYNFPVQRTIARILETNSVECENLRDNLFQGSSYRLLPKEYPIECQVWAYSSRSLRKQTSTARVFKNSGTTDVTNLLLDTFSIVYYTDSWLALDNDQKDALAMLSNIGTVMELDEGGDLYTYEELQLFLRLVQRRNVVFETEAEDLIKGYYVASRRLRNSAKNCMEIAINAVTTLSLIAEAHARISLRFIIIEEDAVAAIFLYEEYLTSKYGSSCFNVQPFPHLMQRVEREDFEMVLEQLESFALNLRKLVSAYGKDIQLENTGEE